MTTIDGLNEIHHGDAIEGMRKLPDNSVDLVLTDPPYNIHIADWDTWPSVEEYVAFMGEVFTEAERVLKPTGSLYWFHNDFPQIVALHNWLDENTSFEFRQFLVWNKLFKGTRNEAYTRGYLMQSSLRNYVKLAEYCLFYTFPDIGPGSRMVQYNVENFKPLREYFRQFQEALGMSKKAIIEAVGQRADHCFRWNSSQWSLCTRETYEELLALLPPGSETGFAPRTYDDLKRENDELAASYEEQRLAYERQRYTFNNLKTHHSVFEYDIQTKEHGHITPKPVEMIKTLILHSSNPGDVVLDPFMGSGTTAVAAVETGRSFIGFEQCAEYVEIGRRRLASCQKVS
jgi:DNA modification methylase